MSPNKARLAATILGISLACAAWTAQAHDRWPDPETAKARMEEAAQRLQLTPEQSSRLKPVIEEHVSQLKAVRDKYPAEPSRQSKREMFQEMHTLRQDYETKVREILTDEQEQEWAKMRDEARARMREHRHEHRDAE
jgi:LAS superfamily LD-carboxypeptidase LdcB